tara:strand:+ start:2045 stop:2233 length:189 start_codon:yes stop_codon:yes gene_type:complete
MKIPTTLNDIIKPSLYDSLSPADRIRYLTIYVQQNKRTNHSQHTAIIEMTDEEFKRRENEDG